MPPAFVGTAVLLLVHAASAQLVGPGAMTPYGGGGGARRHGGFVTIRDAVLGFFISGSSIHHLNGVFGPLMGEDQLASLPFDLASTVAIGAYAHDSSGWILANVKSTENPGETEWVFFDSDFNERFAHTGNTLIPGSGKRWWHLKRPSRVRAANTEDTARRGGASDAGAGTHVSMAKPDDDDELPWQVIGIRDAQRLESLRSQGRQHTSRTEEAARRRGALGAPSPSPPSRATSPPGGEDAVHLPPDAVARSQRGDHAEAAPLYLAAADAAAEGAAASASEGVRWTAAVLYLRSAHASRRAREFDAADHAIGRALGFHPLYKQAIFERALIELDAGRASASLASLRRLHGLDAEFPALRSWLVRAHAASLREEERRRADEQHRASLSTPRTPQSPPGCEVLHIGSHPRDEATAAPQRKAADSAAAVALAADEAKAGVPLAPSKTGCCLSSAAVHCPPHVNRSNWVGGEIYDDTFDVERLDARTVRVTRSDGGDVGWGLDLRVQCCTEAGSVALAAAAEAAAAALPRRRKGPPSSVRRTMRCLVCHAILSRWS